VQHGRHLNIRRRMVYFSSRRWNRSGSNIEQEQLAQIIREAMNPQGTKKWTWEEVKDIQAPHGSRTIYEFYMNAAAKVMDYLGV